VLGSVNQGTSGCYLDPFGVNFNSHSYCNLLTRLRRTSAMIIPLVPTAVPVA
jgi:hypothetical protein